MAARLLSTSSMPAVKKGRIKKISMSTAGKENLVRTAVRPLRTSNKAAEEPIIAGIVRSKRRAIKNSDPIVEVTVFGMSLSKH